MNTHTRTTRCAALSAAALLALGLALALCGCAAPMNYVHPAADLSYVRTVAIVPFKNLTQEKCAEEKVMHMAATEMLRRGVDVVEFGEVARVLRGEGHGRDTGTISKKVAANAAQRLGVQAFLMGAVQEFGQAGKGGDAYPEVCVSMRLLDAKSCTILWEATHTLKGSSMMDRLFGIGGKSRSDLSRDVVQDMLATLFNRRSTVPAALARRPMKPLRDGLAGL